MGCCCRYTHSLVGGARHYWLCRWPQHSWHQGNTLSREWSSSPYNVIGVREHCTRHNSLVWESVQQETYGRQTSQIRRTLPQKDVYSGLKAPHTRVSIPSCNDKTTHLYVVIGSSWHTVPSLSVTYMACIAHDVSPTWRSGATCVGKVIVSQGRTLLRRNFILMCLALFSFSSSAKYTSRPPFMALLWSKLLDTFFWIIVHLSLSSPKRTALKSKVITRFLLREFKVNYKSKLNYFGIGGALCLPIQTA